MARPRAAGYDDQREQILAHAAALFAQQGYTATTMNQVAAACGVTKPTLYHYMRDKQDLLLHIAGGHVARLEGLVAEVAARRLAPEPHLRALIGRFMEVYSQAHHQHRVLTEDVRFLPETEREQVVAAQRRVVAAFAAAIVAFRPDLRGRGVDKPLTMLLLGMMNWTFTWLKADGGLTPEALGRMVADLFCAGLPAVQPVAGRARARGPAAAARPMPDGARGS